MLLAFGACFHALFEGAPAACHFGSSLAEDILVLIELIVGVDPDFDCLQASNQVTFVAAPAALLGFLLLVGILLIKMLIAMLAKTFDTIHETQAQSWQLLFAQLASKWQKEPVGASGVAWSACMWGACMWGACMWGACMGSVHARGACIYRCMYSMHVQHACTACMYSMHVERVHVEYANTHACAACEYTCMWGFHTGWPSTLQAEPPPLNLLGAPFFVLYNIYRRAFPDGKQYTRCRAPPPMCHPAPAPPRSRTTPVRSCMQCTRCTPRCAPAAGRVSPNSVSIECAFHTTRPTGISVTTSTPVPF